MTNETTELPQRSNVPLWLLLGSFLVPAILAYGYFFFGDRPTVASNGQLITPVIDISSLKLTNQNGELLSNDQLTPKWRMYYFVGSSCDQLCQNDLYNLRQMNIALGKYQDRVQHVIAHLDEPANDFSELINTEHQQAIRVYTRAENIQALTAKDADAKTIYLVDPLGNIMMKFPHDLEPKLILKDIKKLLKVSRIG